MKMNYLTGLALVCGALALTLIVSPSYAAVDLSDAFAIWLFDDDGADTVIDHSDKGNDATVTGGAWVDGKFGGGFELQGGNVVSNTVVGVGNEVISQALWVKLDNFNTESQFGFITSVGTASNRFFYFSSWVNGGPHDGVHMGVLNDAGAWGRGMAIVGQFNEDQWYHVVGVADAAAGTHTIYIDGDVVHVENYAAGEIPGEPSQIWAGSQPGGNILQGTIDEVAYFSRALAQEDVEQLMNDGLANVAAVESSGKLPIAWADLKK